MEYVGGMDRSRTLAALADPVRRAVLERLRERPEGCPAGAIGDTLADPVSQPTLSKHLKVLREAGLVRVEREGRVRRYFLAPEPLADVSDWLAAYESFWNGRLDNLADRLADHLSGPSTRPNQEPN